MWISAESFFLLCLVPAVLMLFEAIWKAVRPEPLKRKRQ